MRAWKTIKLSVQLHYRLSFLRDTTANCADNSPFLAWHWTVSASYRLSRNNFSHNWAAVISFAARQVFP